MCSSGLLPRGQPLRQLSNDDYSFIEAAFTMADGGKGYLHRDELKVAMTTLYGYRPSKAEVDNILLNVGKWSRSDSSLLSLNTDNNQDADQSGQQNTYIVTRKAFCSIMAKRLEWMDPLDDIRETFRYFDTRFKGFLDFQDFQNTCKAFLPHTNHQTLLRMFHELDHDGDGRISFHDFELMMESKL